MADASGAWGQRQTKAKKQKNKNGQVSENWRKEGGSKHPTPAEPWSSAHAGGALLTVGVVVRVDLEDVHAVGHLVAELFQLGDEELARAAPLHT